MSTPHLSISVHRFLVRQYAELARAENFKATNTHGDTRERHLDKAMHYKIKALGHLARMEDEIEAEARERRAQA